MITKIWEGKKEFGYTYFQGMLWIIQGRLKHSWIPITTKCNSLIEAQQELDDFKESVK